MLFFRLHYFIFLLVFTASNTFAYSFTAINDGIRGNLKISHDGYAWYLQCETQEQDSAEQDSTEQDSTEQNSAEQDSAEQGSAEQNNTLQTAFGSNPTRFYVYQNSILIPVSVTGENRLAAILIEVQPPNNIEVQPPNNSNDILRAQSLAEHMTSNTQYPVVAGSEVDESKGGEPEGDESKGDEPEGDEPVTSDENKPPTSPIMGIFNHGVVSAMQKILKGSNEIYTGLRAPSALTVDGETVHLNDRLFTVTAPGNREQLNVHTSANNLDTNSRNDERTDLQSADYVTVTVTGLNTTELSRTITWLSVENSDYPNFTYYIKRMMSCKIFCDCCDAMKSYLSRYGSPTSEVKKESKLSHDSKANFLVPFLFY